MIELDRSMNRGANSAASGSTPHKRIPERWSNQNHSDRSGPVTMFDLQIPRNGGENTARSNVGGDQRADTNPHFHIAELDSGTTERGQFARTSALGISSSAPWRHRKMEGWIVSAWEQRFPVAPEHRSAYAASPT
jgi:hypothetical protein